MAKKTYLWPSNWYLYGSLMDKYGRRLIYNASNNSHALVKELISDSYWKWPQPNSLDLMEIKEAIDYVPLGEKMWLNGYLAIIAFLHKIDME